MPAASDALYVIEYVPATAVSTEPTLWRIKSPFVIIEQNYMIKKEVTYGENGKVKGNCDADIVVKAMRDTYENNCDNVILVSSDGDYASLVTFLIEKNKIKTILSPYETKKCSILLKRTGVSIAYINEQKSILKT